MPDNKDVNRKLNVGGEGEEKCCVQINLPWVMEQGENFVASRNGEKIGVKGIKEAGPLVVCDTQHLPFKDGAFSEVVANGVPIDVETHLGPGYDLSELKRVCKNGLLGVSIDGKTAAQIYAEKLDERSKNEENLAPSFAMSSFSN